MALKVPRERKITALGDQRKKKKINDFNKAALLLCLALNFDTKANPGILTVI